MAVFSIEEAVIAWLTGKNYAAAQLMQAGASGVFVTVERVGGGVEDLVDHPSLAIQVWGDTELQAKNAAEQLRVEILLEAPPTGVHSWTVDEGPYLYPDADTRKPRYQMTVDASSQLLI